MTDASQHSAHQMVFGATVGRDHVSFRLFAPACNRVLLNVLGLSEPLAMSADGSGWHELNTSAASAGSEYWYVLDDGTKVPDLASRYQPRDIHGPSEVIDPSEYTWHDGAWHGRPWQEAILYELHVGTFTRQGTFSAAAERLNYLAALGITAVELMCVADFAGNRNWGYDGLLPFAPDSAYGTPDDLKAFIDQAHARGLMVIMDVVYNHFGPEGNFIPRYFPQIMSEQHEGPWGKLLNFDGPGSDVVREFVIQNALYWADEFHVDGLRLDASHAMIDSSPRHVLDELRDRVAAVDWGRPIHLILENEQNIASRLLRNPSGQPITYTAQWNHDITHLLAVAYSDPCASEDIGETRKLTTALTEGFTILARERGAVRDCMLPPTAFVAFLQTHDLVGNRIFGDRISATASAEVLDALSSIYLLLPQIPMLFMGEEWAASTPFPFFCDYHGRLADDIRNGRVEQLKRLDPAPSPEQIQNAPDPQAESTFRSAQLRWDEIAEPAHAARLDWYRRLLHTRRQFVIPLLGGLSSSCGTTRIIAASAFTIEWNVADGARLILAANLCARTREGFPEARGRMIWETASNSRGAFGPWSVRWTVEQASES